MRVIVFLAIFVSSLSLALADDCGLEVPPLDFFDYTRVIMISVVAIRS